MQALSRVGILIAFLLALSGAAFAAGGFTSSRPSAFPSGLDSQPGSGDFLEKLGELLSRTDSSIALVRKQITSSTNAPFLPDLYQQLGELLLEKANGLYFLRAEKQKGAGGAAGNAPDRQVVALQKEAIGVFDRLLDGFPNYEKRPNTMFLLASTLRAVDDYPRFIATIQRLIKEYPDAVESFRGRLLMGEELTRRQQFPEALDYLKPTLDCSFVFEKNLGRYRTALVLAETDKAADALHLLEQVVTDLDLDQVRPDPATRALIVDRGAENLKRDALLDSTRVYPLVYKTDPHPVEYYLKLAPSEGMFQDAIEKLAFRYVSQKQFALAVLLFRALSERIGDPERVLNIYRQVLVSVAPADRLQIPPDEMARVLKLFNRWTAFYQQSDATRKAVYDFFEVQIRDLGTRNHAAAKAEPKDEKGGKKRAEYYAHARDFYQLYLRFFQRTKYSVAIATNLADVYYNRKDRFHSGELYFRIASGEFGAPKNRIDLLLNAITVLQQPTEAGFYEQLRSRGLLVRAIDTYWKDRPAKRTDPELGFVRLSAMYEQGFYDWAIPRLYDFIDKNRGTRYSIDASELVLDYYNTIDDLKGLVAAAGKLLTLKLPDRAFNERVRGIQATARFKRVEKDIQNRVGYAAAAGGKQYLQAALASGDTSVKDAALQEALQLSKNERDVDTFLKTARAMVSKEQTPARKTELLGGLASETVKITRFVAAGEFLEQETRVDENSDSGRKAFAERVRLALLMHDLESVSKLSDSPLWSGIDDDLRKRATTLALDRLSAGARPPGALLDKLVSTGLDEENLRVLYRSKSLLAPPLQASVENAIRAQCGPESQAAICRWGKMDAAEGSLERFVAGLSSAALVPDSVEAKGNDFTAIQKTYDDLGNSGDPYLDALVAIKHRYTYAKLADFLDRVGGANKDLKDLLHQKAAEARETALKFRAACQNTAVAGLLPRRSAAFCVESRNVTPAQFLAKDVRSFASRPPRDPITPEIAGFQKRLFADEDRAAIILPLAQAYAKAGSYYHAVGSASYGLSLNLPAAEDLKVVLGCNLIKLGFLEEARFELSDSKSKMPEKSRCLAQAGSS